MICENLTLINTTEQFLNNTCIRDIIINNAVVPSLVLLFLAVFLLIFIIAIFTGSIAEPNFWIIITPALILALLLIILISAGIISFDVLYPFVQGFLR